MAEIHCRHFNGYKPCGRVDTSTGQARCERGSCAEYESVHSRVLIVHLEALGAVLRSTSLLAAVRRQYPKAHITWVTKAPAHRLLDGLVDRVLTLAPEDMLKLSVLRFDVALVIDKSLAAAGVLKQCDVAEVLGFRADSAGVIVPANTEAKELWELGLSDYQKFHVNRKSEQQLVHEALGLGAYTRDAYEVRLSDEERRLSAERRAQWSPHGRPIVGINTGSSDVLPAKKMPVETQRAMIRKLLNHPELGSYPIVLLGGPEDSQRNRAIAQDLPVILSPTDLGLRDGLASVDACDLVFSGDSLGMHMAIALRKWVVAWFGPTCAHEIDLYGRGVKLLADVPCSPCWKRACTRSVMCYDQVDFSAVAGGLTEGLAWLTSSSKRPFRETSFSPSP